MLSALHGAVLQRLRDVWQLSVSVQAVDTAYVEGLDHQSSLEAFLKQPLFDGKRFWEAEREIEWVDN